MIFGYILAFIGGAAVGIVFVALIAANEPKQKKWWEE